MPNQPQEITTLIHLPAMIAEIEANGSSLSAYKDAIATTRDALTELFKNGAPAAELIGWQSAFIDSIITHSWERTIPASARDSVALVAVGGYGRAELHPHSAIDILILTTKNFTAADEEIGQFVTHLWDLGLDIGHSVRDVKRCIKEAKADITVITNMIESRYVCGNKELMQQLKDAIRPEKIWPVDKFFAAKQQEQRERHLKFHGSAFRLEPNLKESPGGLRDIQTVEWMLIRQYGNSNLQALVSDNYLSQQELDELTEGRDILWSIRFLLHSKSNRKEDRLLFDYQRELATDFGYEQDEERSNEAVEQFMQRYFRTVVKVERLNDMLLQLMEAQFSPIDKMVKKPTADKNFVIVNEYVETTDDTVFPRYPPAMLELFQVFASHEEVRGIGARTLRSLKSNLHLINNKFRSDVIARDLFMQLFREPDKATRKLRLMNRYGVLAAYLPGFEKIVGRMQYDLFHIYTVDEHTLMVIRNLRRFAIPRHNDEYPECSAIMQSIEKQDLLYIIGLFHDIAKGRDGDHCILGAEDATVFCKQHGLDEEDSKLVVWTIRHHLEMSMTAQRKDTSDPDIIYEFARFVGSQRYLDFLYLLTVADIRGTNPELWNSWKQNLLEQLYRHTSNALKRLDNPIDVPEIIARKKSQAWELLTANAVDEAQVSYIWNYCDEQYFLQYSSEEISWHATNMSLLKKGEPLILLRKETERGSTEIFIHIADYPHLFANIVTTIDQLNLTIVSAQILTSLNGWTLNTFFVLDREGEAIQDEHRLESIHKQLDLVLVEKETPGHVERRAPRRLTHFEFEPIIQFDNDMSDESTSLFIKAIDRPGLLSAIGSCFAEKNIRVVSANITTLGETAEDSFYIQDGSRNKVTSEEALAELQACLHATLEK